MEEKVFSVFEFKRICRRQSVNNLKVFLSVMDMDFELIEVIEARREWGGMERGWIQLVLLLSFDSLNVSNNSLTVSSSQPSTFLSNIHSTSATPSFNKFPKKLLQQQNNFKKSLDKMK